MRTQDLARSSACLEAIKLLHQVDTVALNYRHITSTGGVGAIKTLVHRDVLLHVKRVDV